MSKKLLNKQWSELTDKQKKRFSSKSDFKSQKKASTENISPKKAAILAIQQDRKKLKRRDAQRISDETGLSIKKILKIAENKFPDKEIAEKLKTDKGGKKTDIEETDNGGKDNGGKDNGGKDNGGDGGKDNGGGDENLSFGKFEVPEEYDKNYDPFSEIKYPEGKSGKDFKKYKNQRGKILRAAEADLANKRNRDFKPKVLGKAADLRKAFLGDPSKKAEKLTGRAEREYKLKQIGKAKKPNFEKFEKRIGRIRKGKKIKDSKGVSQDYAYSGKFEKLGKKLGVKYGEQKREKRTERRFASLMEGLKNKKLGRAYSTAADDAKTQRKEGRKAMKLFRGESVA